MIIACFDGMTENIFNNIIEYLPNHQVLLNDSNYKHSILYNENLPHTVPSWIQIFSGKTYKDTGIYDFEKRNRDGSRLNEYVKRKDLQGIEFIWDKSNQNRFIVYNLWICIPPLRINCHYPLIWTQWDVLKKNGEEFIFELCSEINSYKWCIDTLLKMRCEVLIWHCLFPDQIHHAFSYEEKYNKPISDKFIKAYKAVDFLLGKMIKQNDDVVIVSDHGDCGAAFEEIGLVEPICAHNRDGFIASNFLSELPSNHSEMYLMFEKYLMKEKIKRRN